MVEQERIWTGASVNTASFRIQATRTYSRLSSYRFDSNLLQLACCFHSVAPHDPSSMPLLYLVCKTVAISSGSFYNLLLHGITSEGRRYFNTF